MRMLFIIGYKISPGAMPAAACKREFTFRGCHELVESALTSAQDAAAASFVYITHISSYIYFRQFQLPRRLMLPISARWALGHCAAAHRCEALLTLSFLFATLGILTSLGLREHDGRGFGDEPPGQRSRDYYLFSPALIRPTLTPAPTTYAGPDCRRRLRQFPRRASENVS